jgi:solute carrier family 25 carnitine/acylcarnitine transporter 20/29
MPESHSSDKYIGFLAGFASGITKLIIGHPFDTVKIRLQTQGIDKRFNGLVDCIKKTMQKEGFLAFYKGATPPLMGWMIMDSVALGSLNNIKLWLSKNGEKKLSYRDHALSGLLTGCIVAVVATPIESLKSKLQVQYDSSTRIYTGPIDCIRKIGVQGVYRGFFANVLFRSFFSVLWSSYELYNDFLRECNVPLGYIPFLSGGLAANTFWTIAFPADVIKNRIMASKDTKDFQGILSCAKYIYRNHGIRGFYRGFLRKL